METPVVIAGNAAPALTLHGAGGRRLSVAELRGRFVAVVFASGRGAEVAAALADLRARLAAVDASAIVVCDGRAWFVPPGSAPQAYWPPGEIAARMYGRSPSRDELVLAVVDPEGSVRFAYRARASSLADALAEALQRAAKDLCASRRPIKVATPDWKALAVVASLALGLGGSTAPAARGPARVVGAVAGARPVIAVT
ncbi:MAG TPA: hypothetical protein VE987_13810 [Polyangiaceae bacterium]|nr:hypothetical protein [Polyangiaceae bacterium]